MMQSILLIAINYKLAALKKLFAISFLFIYLYSTTELHQLLKAPLLVGCFIEHGEKKLSFKSRDKYRRFLEYYFKLLFKKTPVNLSNDLYQ